MVNTWAPTVQSMGFDGIHWDTLGPIAGDYDAEASGTHAFLQEAQALLAGQYNLLQTMNFVSLAWWDHSIVKNNVTFPYAEVWSQEQQNSYYTKMANPLFNNNRGVIAHYLSVDNPEDIPQSQLMIERWNDAHSHNLVYLLIGDGNRYLSDEFFPDNKTLSPEESTALSLINCAIPSAPC